MRFFLVRIVVFTITFTLLFLLLSWIFPTWTGNTVASLTRWRPIQEQSQQVSDSLTITDLSSDKETPIKQNTETTQGNQSINQQAEAPSHSGSVNNRTREPTNTIQNSATVEEATPPKPATIITKDKQEIEDNAIETVNKLLGVDGVQENTDTITIEQPKPEPVTELTQQELNMLEKFEQNTQ